MVFMLLTKIYIFVIINCSVSKYLKGSRERNGFKTRIRENITGSQP